MTTPTNTTLNDDLGSFGNPASAMANVTCLSGFSGLDVGANGTYYLGPVAPYCGGAAMTSFGSSGTVTISPGVTRQLVPTHFSCPAGSIIANLGSLSDGYGMYSLSVTCSDASATSHTWTVASGVSSPAVTSGSATSQAVFRAAVAHVVVALALAAWSAPGTMM